MTLRGAVGHTERREEGNETVATVPADVQGPSDAELIESVRGGTIDAYGQLAKTTNTMIVPGNMTEVSGLIATAMAVMQRGAPPAVPTP